MSLRSKHSPCEIGPQVLTEWFAAGGALSRVIQGYTPRDFQVEMAVCVSEALDKGGVLVAEAGTGTGKTLAYLVPALLSGRQVIVATGSRNLQDQLFGRDLPRLLECLRHPLRVVQLKGRGNYLCHYRLQQATEVSLLQGPGEQRALERIHRWYRISTTGDIAEMAELAEDWWGWPQVTSTDDNCLGQDCPFVADCFVFRARRQAQEADLIVTNHHLLCADWRLRSEKYGALLPEAHAVIVDEAHQFAETAARFLGENVTSRQLHELIGDTLVELRQAGLASPPVRQRMLSLRRQLEGLQAAFAVAPARASAAELDGLPEVLAALEGLDDRLKAFAAALQPLSGASQGLESCWQRCRRLGHQVANWLAGDEGDRVRWFTASRKRFSLQTTPLEVAGSFTGYRKAASRTWVFTSATLSVADRFDHFLQQLGLSGEEVVTRLWPSPFDYRYQAMLYLPGGLPPPNAPDYTVGMIASVEPVLRASGGRAFVLFTSHRALREAAGLLENLPFPLLVQGEAPKALLLERFRALGNAVLLGTASFWEGVDVQGPALSCVIIDKLPFASPGDPVCRARLASLKQRGYDPFSHWQLPAAVIALKQGAGRLIRGHDDRGVLVLCDPRLTARSYGRVFLNSLPPMPETRALEAVERFFGEEKS